MAWKGNQSSEPLHRSIPSQKPNIKRRSRESVESADIESVVSISNPCHLPACAVVKARISLLFESRNCWDKYLSQKTQ